MTGTPASLRNFEAEVAWVEWSIKLACHILGRPPREHRAWAPQSTVESKYQVLLGKSGDRREAPGRAEGSAL